MSTPPSISSKTRYTTDLDGYEELRLADGTHVLHLAGYCRHKLEDLAWPRLRPTAARHLRLLREALAGLDALAAAENG